MEYIYIYIHIKFIFAWCKCRYTKKNYKIYYIGYDIMRLIFLKMIEKVTKQLDLFISFSIRIIWLFSVSNCIFFFFLFSSLLFVLSTSTYYDKDIKWRFHSSILSIIRTESISMKLDQRMIQSRWEYVVHSLTTDKFDTVYIVKQQFLTVIFRYRCTSISD